MILLLLTTSTAMAGPPSVSLGFGPQALPALMSQVDIGRTTQAALRWKLGPAFVGAAGEAAFFNGPDYWLQGEADRPLVAGDFAIFGLGPSAALPAVLETRTLRIGVHADLAGERLFVPMDKDYYESDVLNGAWGGQSPRIDRTEWLLRAAAGVDFALAVANPRPSPEVLLSLAGNWRTTVGPGVVVSLGLRVGADD